MRIITVLTSWVGVKGIYKSRIPPALMFFLTGLRAKKVHALMHNHGLAVDLVDTMAVEFENNALGMVGGTGNAGKNYRLALSVYCEQGCFVSDSMARFGVIRKPDGSEEELFTRPPKSDRKENDPVNGESIQRPATLLRLSWDVRKMVRPVKWAGELLNF